jgi:NAD+ synthase (glutamine-hydrolysing)
MNIAMCQFRPQLGNVAYNVQRIIEEARAHPDADLVVFPELALTANPVFDNLNIKGFEHVIAEAIHAICDAATVKGQCWVVGAPLHTENGGWYNGCVCVAEGRVVYEYAKQCLPTYDVFNDARYFVSGTESGVFEWSGKTIGVLICEDIWADTLPERYTIDPVVQLVGQGLEVVLHLSSSPFARNKLALRRAQIQRCAKVLQVPVVHVNQVGGYTDILFDGQSMVVAPNGDTISQCPAFCEASMAVNVLGPNGENTTSENLDVDSDVLVLNALCMGLQDYVSKTGLNGVVVGVSGGIDSAVVAGIAVMALGAERVTLVSLPTRYNSEETQDDAKALAKNLGCGLQVIKIEAMRTMMQDTLVASQGRDVTEITKQNIQARLRGVVLMAIANDQQALLCTTGNKSELAMGYATLYGDMCGGLNFIGDLWKHEVYAMAKCLNRYGDWIPESIIHRAPSAELAEGQQDADSLPPYSTLDAILEAHIIHRESWEVIAGRFDADVVGFVRKQLMLTEFKREQAAPVVKVSDRAFGRGWQMPVTT